MVDPAKVKDAWFRRESSLADTVGDLMLSTALKVPMRAADGSEENVLVQTVSYATLVMVQRGSPMRFGDLAIMSADEEEVIDLTEIEAPV